MKTLKSRLHLFFFLQLTTSIETPTRIVFILKDWNNLPINIIEARDIDEFIYILNYCNY